MVHNGVMNTKTLPPLQTLPEVRLTIPVSAEVHAVFSRMAKAGRMPVGRCMAEWLADTIDAAEFMASKMEQARATPKLVARELHSYALGLSDMTTDLLDSMKAPREGGAGGAVSAPAPPSLAAMLKELKTPLTPPSSNTGGKVPKNDKKAGGRK
jgi:hypothetical protein